MRYEHRPDGWYITVRYRDHNENHGPFPTKEHAEFWVHYNARDDDRANRIEGMV